MIDEDVHGPIDFLLVEWPGDKVTGEAADALLDLVDKGTVRVYDVCLVSKGDDGSIAAVDLGELDGDGFGTLAGARSGLLSEQDMAEAADALERGTVGALIVYENTWAIPFVRAARKAGAELVASARLSAQDVMDTLDALEALDAKS
ncbi:MAG TPA: DUF6325 family protein [Acidimicrobiales bacterium]|nr:DUF6325 family protein [Acidimicrobiales bacterium]